MSTDLNKTKFEQLISDVRYELQTLKKYVELLENKIGNQLPDEDVKNWILDVFLDKLYDVDQKIVKILSDLNNSKKTTFIKNIVTHAQSLPFQPTPTEVSRELTYVKDYFLSMTQSVETSFSDARYNLKLKNWNGLDSIKPIEYVLSERKKYVNARDELNKAKENSTKNIEDVMGNLRTAIDLAIKERFGFEKIHKMLLFLEDAEKQNFPLPSYSIIYTYFNEGSKRLHEGKIHTHFEAKEAIRTVSNFIDELELIQITQQRIDDFKNNCKYME